MKSHHAFHAKWAMPALILISIVAGCAGPVNGPTVAATLEQPPTSIAEATSIPVVDEATPTSAPVPVLEGDVLYRDDFTKPATGWPAAKFDNYFIGYHEPEYYHIEIDSPNSRTTAFIPEKTSFDDFTMEVEVLTNSTKTAASGDFIYGPIFRRSGDQYYAFAISPRSKKWFVLKSSPNTLMTLAEGEEASIHDLDVDDDLRVDAQGSTFYFHINGRLVGQVVDPDYTSGEAGFYVQAFDSTQTHVHFDTLTIRNFEAPEPTHPQSIALYRDDFTKPATGWPAAKFDNYFIGYHEPEYYHIEIDSPNSRTTAFIPEKTSFDDFTMEVEVLTNSTKTAASGDFIYGPIFRRSGDQYYAFAISPRSKKWFVLKSSPNTLMTLAEGEEASIHDLDVDDDLRVDAQGSTFYFHINGRLVGQVVDPDYTSGEAGFYVQAFDSTQTHVHFDTLTIWDYDAPSLCSILSISKKLNVRSGPGTTFPSSSSLSKGDLVEPIGRSPDGKWIKINVQGSGEQGWIADSPQFVSCNKDVSLLPVISQ